MNRVDQRYIDTFRQHRVLFAVPVVLALIVAVWTVVGAPKTYQSTASLWFDNAPPASSSQSETDPSLRTPAAQRQLILDELLATRQFRIDIGHRSPLADYLTGNPSSGSGPMVLLSKALRKTAPLDERILEALDRAHVATAVLGPQVLSVSVSAGTPSVAAETLTALLDNFVEEEGAARIAHARAANTYYQDLVAEASKAAADAQQNVRTYMAERPERPENDPSLTTLTQAAAVAAVRLSEATNSLNQASVTLAHVTDTSPLRYLDEPTVPPRPAGGGKKKIVLGAAAGMFAGGMVSLLGLLAMTYARTYRGAPPTTRQPANAHPILRPGALNQDGRGPISPRLGRDPGGPR